MTVKLFALPSGTESSNPGDSVLENRQITSCQEGSNPPRRATNSRQYLIHNRLCLSQADGIFFGSALPRVQQRIGLSVRLREQRTKETDLRMNVRSLGAGSRSYITALLVFAVTLAGPARAADSVEGIR